MYKLNENYNKLQGSYLFSTVARKVREYQEKHPDAEIIRLGIGDVTQPIAPIVIKALHDSVDEMARAESFHGYAPDLGYSFLRDIIAKKDYADIGCKVDADEIFVSDGAKSDTGNFQELFDVENRVAICDPVYPVYMDSNVMAGRCGDFDTATGRYSKVIYMPTVAENNFCPDFPKENPDIIYLCSPNNPTGTALNKDQLKSWVDYALKVGAIILFDGAYEAYITEKDIPHSIYEIEGARGCCVEFRSFSKKAGFTGLRLGYTVVPKDIKLGDVSLNAMWARRHGTKYNGAPYIIQRAGEACYSDEGDKEIREQIAKYQKNAAYIANGLKEAGYEVYGAINSPYIWLKTPNNMTSWEFFDMLLDKAHVVGTPGSGFGPSGEHYFRLTAFGSYDNSIKAIDRIKKIG